MVAKTVTGDGSLNDKSTAVPSDTAAQTMHSVGQANHRYPRCVSDRADALRDALDAAQCERLYQALGKKTYHEWSDWIETQKKTILQFDALTAVQRKRKIQTAQTDEPLFLLHACLWLELARARLHATIFHLPPRGLPFQNEQDHREAMLHIRSAFELTESSARDFWPFDYPDGADPWPFLDGA